MYWMYWDVMGCNGLLSHLLCVSGFGIFEPVELAPCVSAVGHRNGGCHVVPQRVYLKNIKFFDYATEVFPLK